MAKRFGGFTPQQQQTLLSKMGYTGPAQQDDINKFMMSSPKAASMMGRYAQMAKARVEGGPQMAMQVGGYMAPPTPMQQMQERATNLDYNRLYAQPNQQPMQQPIAMQEGGMADTTTKVFDPISGKNLTPFQINNRINSPNLGQPYANAGITSAQDFLNTNTPNTSGGFDMGAGQQYTTGQEVFQDDYTGANERAVEPEPTYDPSQGLPTAPEAPDVTPYLKDTSAGQTTHLKTGVENLLKSGDLPEDPSNYTITGGKRNWTITFDNGQTVKSTVKNPASAENDARVIAEAISGYKESDIYKGYQAGQEQYQQNVDIYNQYTTGAAQEKAQTPVAQNIKASQDAVNVSTNLIATYNKQLSVLAEDDPRRAEYEKRIADEQVKLNQANAELTTAKQQQSAEQRQASTERIGEFEADPAGQATKADVATVSEADREAGMIDDTVGQAGEVADAEAAEVTRAGDVTVPVAKEAATYDAITASPEVQSTLDKLEAATGKPSAEALAEAQTMDPEELAQLGLSAAQIEEAVQVQAPAKRTVQEGELLGEEDVTVDMERVEKEALNFEAATGTPSTEATVQGQLTNLMEDFEGGETPAWAAGAMRAATQRMAARGLAASSMAGQAIVQAAMESAMPIAMADAQTMASFEAQNLSNRQAAAMMKAEQRAKFLGMEFDQGFQIRVQNAAKIADIANQNFTAEVQIALENARLANTVDLANLDAKNAKILSDAAAMSNMELTNLNNRQQAAIQQANAFLNFDMKEFDAKQQVAMFKTQAQTNAILSDTAAENAAEQFNATSENQTNQFYDSLISTVEQFNVDQANAMERFEADQANQLSKFNAEMDARREEFNAANALIVAQANAKWDQEIALAETAATNAANSAEAQAANNMTTVAYEASKQADRDTMSYAFQTANNNADRATEIALQTMRNESAATTSAASKSAALAEAAGAVVSAIVTS